MSRKLTQEDFIKRSITAHQDKYSYEKAVYTGRLAYVDLYCNEHDTWFEQAAGWHMDGQTSCHECIVEKKNLSRKIKRLKKSPIGSHHCKTCDKILPVDNFYKNPWGANGFHSVCKICKAEKSLNYRSLPENIVAIKLRNSTYVKREKHKWNLKTAKRRANRQKATRKFVDEEFEEFIISEVYHLASIRSAVMNFSWQVDHIVPITSETVCGFHVWNNLQVIPAASNLSKGNRYWPEMW